MWTPTTVKNELISYNEVEIIQIICDSIIEKFENKPLSNIFLKRIIKSPSPKLELILGEEYWLKQLDTNKLKSIIQKKETKINTYKSSKNLDKCWLLLIIDGASSISSFEIKDNILLDHTLFNKVFIFNSFQKEIIAEI